MRVAPRELRAVRRDGILGRFALLGPVAYVQVDVPPEGSAGTGFERRSTDAGWGFVLRGEVTTHGAAQRTFGPGTAFYLPPGEPAHWLSATGRTIVAGFAPVAADLDASDPALERHGFEVMAVPVRPAPLPASIRPMERSSVFQESGAIEVETALMGQWVFMRTVYGPMSGYTTGWCALPHWGLVLRGDLALHAEDGVELLTPGDVYYCPAGPPSHRFLVPDAATTIDYTPLDALESDRARTEWRRTAFERAVAAGTLGDSRPRPAEPSDVRERSGVDTAVAFRAAFRTLPAALAPRFALGPVGSPRARWTRPRRSGRRGP